MKTLVLGAGAIGGMTGGYLTQAGFDVTLVDRVAAHVQAMQQHGLTIDGVPGEINIPVTAVIPSELTGQFDTIFLTVKSQHTVEALAFLEPFVKADTVIVSLQNGLANKRLIAEKFGTNRAMGAMVRLGGGYQGPGRVTHLTEGLMVVGELNGSLTPRLERICSMLNHVTPTTSTDNLWGWLWAKEIYAGLLKVTALVDATIAEVLAMRVGAQLSVEVMREYARVALAEGVRLEVFDFLDPYALLGDRPEDRARTAQDLQTISERFGHTKSGIWRDIVVRKIPTEVPYSGGEILRRGQQAGVPMPLLSKLIDLIAEIEAGDRDLSPQNLTELASVL